MSVTRAPLVGRQTELDKLGRALDAANSGDPTFVLVHGEAGIGKTAILRATSWLAETRGLRVLTGTAIATGTAIPYLPLIAPLRAAVAALPSDAGPVRAVRQLLDAEPDAGDRPRPARTASLVEAIYDILTMEPTALVVDDVHWADGATMTVLDYLAHRAEGDRLAVVTAARDDELGGLGSLPIADGRRYLLLRVERLDRAAVAEQIALLTGDAASERAVETLFERSAGIPLFVEELLADATADGDPAARMLPPASLRNLLAGRIGRLSPDARHACEALAVIGDVVTTDLLAAVVDLPADATADALREAEHGGVAVRRPSGHGLRHPLFGEVLAADLDGTPRGAGLHARAATALAAAGAGPAVTARHWLAAGDRARAWSDSLAAGQQAEVASAYGEAREHFERAAAMWPASTDGRGTTLLRAARNAWIIGDADDAVTLGRDAFSAGVDGPGPMVELAEFLWDSGRRAESTALFAEAARAPEADSSPSVRARILWGLGRARIGEGDYADARRLGLQAAETASAVGDEAMVSHGVVLAGMARMWDSDIGGTDDLERGLAAALRSGDAVAIGHAYQFTTDMLELAGRIDDALTVGREGVATCDRLGLARSHGSDVRAALGRLLVELGEWRAADALLDNAEPRAGATFARAVLALRRGEWEAWERDAAAAETELSIGGRGRLDGIRELARAELAWLRGRAEDGLRQLDGIGWLPGVWAADTEARTALWCARLGRRPERPGAHPDPRLATAIDAELAARRTDEPAAWERAVVAWHDARRPYERAIALVSAAEAAYQRGDRAAGRPWLLAAARAAAELGAAPILARAMSLARRAHVRLDPGVRHARPNADPTALTAREREVLGLLAEGRTNPQIAQELFISPKTVSIHVQRVLEKLDAHTRGEAVAQARRRGQLP